MADVHAWAAQPIEMTVTEPPSPVEDMFRWRRDPKFSKVRARLFPRKSKQPEDLVRLLSGSGMEEFVKPICETMRALGTWPAVKTPTGICDVPVNHILSHSWQDCRLQRLFQKWTPDARPPPVTLIEVRFLGENFYLVCDGNHRTEAAKIRGEETIETKIEDVMLVEADKWSLEGSAIRNHTTGDLRDIAPDIGAVARWLGVKRQTRKAVGKISKSASQTEPTKAEPNP